MKPQRFDRILSRYRPTGGVRASIVVLAGLAVLVLAGSAAVAASVRGAKHAGSRVGASGQKTAGGTWDGQPLPTTQNIPITATSHPWNGGEYSWVPINLPAYGYTEDEYSVSGTANAYQVVPDSNYQTTVLDTGPYTTNIVINRPSDMRKWSGRVVVEMTNSSADYDWPAIWGALWQSVIARHDIYVSITVKPNVFCTNYSASGTCIAGMQVFDPARYDRLSMANPLPPAQQTCGLLPSDPGYNSNLSKLNENGLAYDMVAQLGELLKSHSPSNPLGRPAKLVVLSGESQQGGYVYRYYKWITPQAVLPNSKPIYDGYLIEDSGTGPSTTTGLNQCEAPLASTDPQTVLPGRPEPLAVINSQEFYPKTGRPANSNTPTDKFWLWMAAGASHGWQFQYNYSDASWRDQVQAGCPGFTGAPVTATTECSGTPGFGHFYCSPAQPEINLYMFEKKLYADLDRWIRTGTPPPTAPDPVIVNGQYVLDANGNMEGGLRMPEMQVPIATYSATIEPSPSCNDAVDPFGYAQLQSMYPAHSDYVRKFDAAAKALVREGFLFRSDANTQMRDAAVAPVPGVSTKEAPGIPGRT